MSPQNLTNVYNQNPTLQSQYTLQQYLDLFGGTPPTATIPPSDPNAPTTPIDPGIPSIINQNINQYQGGGDGGGGITTIGSNRINSNDPTFRDPLNDLIESKLSVEDREKYSDNMYNIQETKTGFIDGVKNTATDLLDLYKTYSPIGFIGRKIEQAKKSKIERERVAAEKARKEREAQATIAAAEERAKQIAANRIQAANQQNNTGGYQSSWSGNNDFMGGGDRGTGMGASDKGGSDSMGSFKKGGRVGYRSGGFSVLGSSSMTDAVMKRIEALMDEGLDFGSAYTQVKKEAPALAHGGRVESNNSGSLTEFVKSKLMEDDSQGLPAVQGIAIGMPSDQDGIISISRR